MSSYLRNSVIDIEGRIPASRTGDIKIIFESIHLGAQKEVIHPAMHRPICYGQRVEAGTKQGELLLLSLNDSSIIRYAGSPSEQRAKFLRQLEHFRRMFVRPRDFHWTPGFGILFPLERKAGQDSKEERKRS